MKYPHSAPILWMIDGLGYGGAEQLMIPILGKLKSVFPVRVCSLQNKFGNPIAGEIKSLDIPVDQLNFPNLRSPSNLPKLLRYLKTQSPALLHTQLQLSDILGTFSAKILNVPSVSTQHSIEYIAKPYNAKLRQNLTWFILRNFSDLVIAVSNQTKNFHITKGKINPQKIVTLHNGINISQFRDVTQNAPKNIRTKHGIPPTAKVLLTVAVLRKMKGIQHLITALPKILEKHPNTYYLVVGDGSYREPLIELAEKENVSDHVIFAGHQTDVPAYLSACDLFVLPTLIDAFPTVLLEAMAAKKPIIASDVGGVPEIIEDNHTGILVEPENINQLAEKISLLLGDSDKATSFAENGFERVVKNFSVANQVNQLEKIYMKLINER